MSDETVIEVKNVHKHFTLPHEKQSTLKGRFISSINRSKKNSTQQIALNDVSFEVKKGEFFGIVGRNGSGKSTLLKMLAGIYQPSKGTVSVHGKLVPFIELGVGFNPELTGRENVYLNGALLNFSKQEVDGFYSEVVKFAELEDFMDQKLKNYSSGMQVRLAFSMAVQAKADILLIDEVLAVGDADFQYKCFNYFREIKKQNVTVVFVSHDMNSVREFCDRAILIEEGQATVAGSPNTIADRYTKLFIGKSGDNVSSREENRQGTGKVKISKISRVNTIKSKKENLIIEFLIEAKESVDSVLAGFSCKNSADLPIAGTNTTIENSPIGNMSKGEAKSIKFEVPNVFNNGKYFLDLVVVSADGEIYDWIIEAVEFNVKTEKKTGYLLELPIRVEVKNA